MTPADAREVAAGLTPEQRDLWLHPANRLPVRSSYPLPVTACGVAYWQMNLLAMITIPGWADWQAKKEMTEIIPAIIAVRVALGASQ